MTASSPVTGTQDRPLVGIGWILAAGLVLSVMDGLIKWSVGAFPVAQVVFVRSAFVLLFLGVALARTGFRAVRTKRPLGHLVRVIFTLAAILTFFESVRLLPLATVIAIGFGAPLFMTALSVAILRERVGIHRWAAIAVGFTGVLVITRPGPEGISWPALLALISSMLFAAHLVTARYLARTETDAALMFWQNLGVFLVTGLLAPFAWSPLSAADLAGIATMAALLLIGQFCTVRAFRTAPVGAVAPFQYVELIWAAAIGYVFWQEVPPANVWFGAAIVVGAGLYAIWSERARAR
ncbi:MAG TPA: DMT family transporter [Alphaproteobacteria bacterium]|nr:DMT family transporter [Alphaproteobacteria bacterium]